MNEVIVTAVIEPDEGGFHAWVPELRGCHTFGATFEEALANIQEAATLHIEAMTEDGEALPAGSAPVVLTTLSVPLAS